MPRRLIYVASPIMKGDLVKNIRQAHEAGLALMKAGFAVIVPHGSVFWGNVVRDGAFVPERECPGTTAEDWYAMDEELVRRCDAVLRLPGEGTGSDREVALARSLGKPVFFSVAEAVRALKPGGPAVEGPSTPAGKIHGPS